MHDHTNESQKGLRALKKVIGDALDLDADIVHLEYADDGLAACFRVGDVALEKIVCGRDSESDVVQALVDAARIHNASRGRMTIRVRRRNHTIVVEEYDHFGEKAFLLTFDRKSKKTHITSR